MSYATPAVFEERYGTEAYTVQADRDQDGIVEIVAVQTSLDHATGVIDAYIGKVYQLPLPEPFPQVLEHCCVEIAAHFISRDQGTFSREKRKRYEDCIALLAMIAEGKLGLGDPDADDLAIGEFTALEGDVQVWTREVGIV